MEISYHSAYITTTILKEEDVVIRLEKEIRRRDNIINQLYQDNHEINKTFDDRLRTMSVWQLIKYRKKL